MENKFVWSKAQACADCDDVNWCVRKGCIKSPDSNGPQFQEIPSTVEQKLHLLQQEYYDLKRQHESLEKQAIKQSEILCELQQEYDKLKEENNRLTQWKKQQMAVTLPVLEWGRTNPNLLAGDDIFKKALEFAKRAEAYERALREISKRYPASYFAGITAIKALESYNANTNQNENNG